jgi:hypothetical protein
LKTFTQIAALEGWIGARAAAGRLAAALPGTPDEA